MAKAKVVEEASTPSFSVVATVYDQTGEVVNTFTSVDEAYVFAGENGYRVEVKPCEVE